MASTSSLRLAYLISRYPAVNHTYLLREVRELRRNGFAVQVVSVLPADRPPASLDQAERAEQESTCYVSSAGAAGWLAAHLATLASRPLRYLAGIACALRLGEGSPRETARWLRWFGQAVIAGRWIEARGIRHVHCHYASSVALLASRVFSFTVSHTIHGPAEFENPALFRLREKIESARFVVAISQYGRSQLMRYAPPSEWAKFAVCRLGVETARYAGLQAAPKTGPFTVLSVGTLSPEKGFPLLIDALEGLAGAGRDLRARIVGDGPFRAALTARLAQTGLGERIRLEGALRHEAVVPLYGNSHAFVLASFAEGIPVVLMEAMAAGLPCVATRITGVPELIEDGVDGLLVPAGDAGALPGAIARLMEVEDLRRRLGEAARRKVAGAYEGETNGRLLAAIFRERLAGENGVVR